MSTLSELAYTNPYWIFLLPLVFAGADIASGCAQAIINGVLDSTKMRKGLYRKGLDMLIVILAFITECAVEPAKVVHLATCASGYIVLMESLSIFENLGQAGVDVPPFIRDKLKKIKDDVNNKGNN